MDMTDHQIIEQLRESLAHQRMRVECANKQRNQYRRANQELVLKLNNIDHSLNVKLAFALTMLQDVLVNGWTEEKKKRACQAMSDFLSPFPSNGEYKCASTGDVVTQVWDDESESQREAAGTADEKPDGQEENAATHAPGANEKPLK